MDNNIKELLKSISEEAKKKDEKLRNELEDNNHIKAKSFISKSETNAASIDCIITKALIKEYIKIKENELFKDIKPQTHITIPYDYIACISSLDFKETKSIYNAKHSEYVKIEMQDLIPEEYRDAIKTIHKNPDKYNYIYKSNNWYTVIGYKENNNIKKVIPAVLDREFFETYGISFNFNSSGITMEINAAFKDLEQFIINVLYNNLGNRLHIDKTSIKESQEKLDYINRCLKNKANYIEKTKRNLNLITLETCKKIIEEFKKNPNIGEEINYQVELACLYPQEDSKEFNMITKIIGEDQIKKNNYYEKDNYDYEKLLYFPIINDGDINYLPVVRKEFEDAMKELGFTYELTNVNNKETNYIEKMVITANSLQFTNLVIKSNDKKNHK